MLPLAPIVLGLAAAQDLIPLWQYQQDPRFSGTYYGSHELKVKVKGTALGFIPVSKTVTIRIDDIVLELEHRPTSSGGVLLGGGRATYDGRVFPFVVSGKVVVPGICNWLGGARVVSDEAPGWEFETLEGPAFLTGDGVSLMVPLTFAQSQKVTPGATMVVLAKDAGSNTFPSVHIGMPAAGEQLTPGASVSFGGVVTDAEQASIPDSHIVWRSDRDGLLGWGADVVASLKSTGPHVISLQATDQGGLTGTDSIGVTVVNQPPMAVWLLQPSAETVLTAGCPVRLAARSFDFEDEWLTGNALTWSSDRDGFLAAGHSEVVTLTAGTHLITATATDSGGLSKSATGPLAVIETGRGPLAVPVINWPSNGDSVVASSQPQLLFGTALVCAGGLESVTLEWYSGSGPLQALIGTGAVLPHVFTLSSPPASEDLTLRLRAVDGQGNDNWATVTVTVKAF